MVYGPFNAIVVPEEATMINMNVELRSSTTSTDQAGKGGK